MTFVGKLSKMKLPMTAFDLQHLLRADDSAACVMWCHGLFSPTCDVMSCDLYSPSTFSECRLSAAHKTLQVLQ